MPVRTKSRVLVLNCGSSSGKSSIARALQELLPGVWLTFGVDTFIESLPGRGDSPRSGIGFDERGAVILSDGYSRLENVWYSGLSAMVEAGADIILEEVLVSGGAGQERLRSAFAGRSQIWVGVRCDADVAAARDAARGDRAAGMARLQASIVHEGVSYDVEVDTTRSTPDECARVIGDFLRATA
ncbi:chloramphenicol phosphotransferase CPT family protein [Herbiconiux liangxiaofengii]|uniref:chloramphenicol phosphotransferase CPT family protein n=1 Tax=Herbiconiux liangxiaofengii TaxID=3342795 RepID=UPI0035B9835C